MTDARSNEGDRRTRLFLILYALATAGSVIAYSPFLVLVLPTRVAALTGPDSVWWFGQITLAGSLAASIGGVAAGMLSDLTRRRRPWVIAGLALTTAMLPVMGRIEAVGTLLVAMVAWQVSLNMLLIPLAAWAADRIPPDRTGRLGGLLALAPVVGAWSGLVLAGAREPLHDRLWVIALIVVATVAPILLATERLAAGDRAPATPSPAGAARRMWIARLLIQIGAGAPSSYLLFWLRSLDPAIGSALVTLAFAAGLTLAAVAAMLLGRWIDRRGGQFSVLAAIAVVAALGLVSMASTTRPSGAVAAYLVFSAAAATFLALHAGQTLRVLPDPSRFGRDIGLFNLTNTLPSLIVPVVVIAVVPRFGYPTLFWVSAALCIAAAITLPGLGARRFVPSA